MASVTVVGTGLLELVRSMLVINGLAGPDKKIPLVWAGLLAFVATASLLVAPPYWENGRHVLTLLYVRLGYGVSWRDSLITVVLDLLLDGAAELACFFIWAVLSNGGRTNCWGSLVSTLLCCVLARGTPLWRLRGWCQENGTWYMATVLFGLALTLSAAICHRMTLELDLGDCVYIVSCMVLVWLMGLRMAEYRYEEEASQRYLEAFCEVIDQIKRRQHKFKNQLDVVYSLHSLYDSYEALVEEQKKYVGKLADYVMPTDVLVLGNPIWIAHVYGKVSEAQEAGLKVRMTLRCRLEGCGVGDIHMVEILGTLFDNAIQDMKETGQTEFLIFEVKKDGGITIRMANPHRELRHHEIQRMFKDGFSTKGAGRGVGLYNVKKLVQRHGMNLIVENRAMDGKNYICFTIIIRQDA